jgi:hypothetical protein
MAKTRSRDETKPTPASIALNRLLLEDGPIARSLRLAISRQQLGKWRAAKRRPAPEGMKLIRVITKKRIDYDHWVHDELVDATLARLARLRQRQREATPASAAG